MAKKKPTSKPKAPKRKATAKRKESRARKKTAPKKATRKTTARKKPTPPAPAFRSDIVEGLVLLLCSGISADTAGAKAAQKWELTPELAGAHVLEASRRITLAADYNRDEELGKAHTRLNLIYAKSLTMSDLRVSLAAQKELNRLLDLTQTAPPDEEPKAAERQNPEADAIRAHLVPLLDTDDTTPLPEVARLAALFILKRPL